MKLMDLLPPAYENNVTMAELQGLLTDRVSTLIADLDGTVDECFLETASKLLSRYEKVCGADVDVGKPDTFRREILKAKIRGIGTVTKQLLMETAASYSNGDVEVIENPAHYSFVVKFTGTLGIPPNLDGLKAAVEEIKPAHLAVTYAFTYTVWREVRAAAWATVKTGTWGELRTRKIL